MGTTNKNRYPVFLALFALLLGAPSLFACEDFSCDSAVVAEILKINDIKDITVNAVTNPYESGQLQRRVNVLYLGNLGIEKLPESINDLTDLWLLELYGNKLSEIPAALLRNPEVLVNVTSNRLCTLSEEMVDFLDERDISRNNWRAHQKKSDSEYCDGVAVCNSLECELDVVRDILTEHGISEDDVEFSFISGVDNNFTSNEIVIADENHINRLYLSNLGLNNLSADIRKLEHITTLHLSNNNLEKLPAALLYYNFTSGNSLYPNVKTKSLRVDNNRFCSVTEPEHKWLELQASTVESGSEFVPWNELQTSDGTSSCDIEVTEVPDEMAKDPFVLKPQNVSIILDNNTTFDVADRGDYLSITLPFQGEAVNFELLDLKGRVIWNQKSNQNILVPKNEGFRGVMILKAHSSSFNHQQKLIFE